MNDIPTITQIVMRAIGITFVLLLAYDVIAYMLGGNDATISRAMIFIGKEWPIVVVAWGILASHFFAPDDQQWTGWWNESKPYVLLALGMLVGRLAWPQVVTFAKMMVK